MNNKKIAIMYDFDKTLCPKNMQDYGFINDVGYDSLSFWNNATKFANENKMDQILAYMYYMLITSKKVAKPLTKAKLNKYGSMVELCLGVDKWFERINNFGLANNIQIEHYVISCGLKELIDGTSIAEEFKEIFSCEYLYDDNGEAVWPKTALNYTTKTQFLFRINKGALNLDDDIKVNELIPEDQRAIPFENMIYIGDGLTDIPCMQLMKDRNGTSIAVFQDDDSVAKHLMADARVDYIAKADYRDGEMLDVIVKKIIKEKSYEV